MSNNDPKTTEAVDPKKLLDDVRVAVSHGDDRAARDCLHKLLAAVPSDDADHTKLEPHKALRAEAFALDSGELSFEIDRHPSSQGLADTRQTWAVDASGVAHLRNQTIEPITFEQCVARIDTQPWDPQAAATAAGEYAARMYDQSAGGWSLEETLDAFAMAWVYSLAGGVDSPWPGSVAMLADVFQHGEPIGSPHEVWPSETLAEARGIRDEANRRAMTLWAALVRVHAEKK